MNKQTRLNAHKAKFEGFYFTAIYLFSDLVAIENNQDDIYQLDQLNRKIKTSNQNIEIPF